MVHCVYVSSLSLKRSNRHSRHSSEQIKLWPTYNSIIIIIIITIKWLSIVVYTS